MKNPWDVLRAGDIAGGLAMMRLEFAREPDGSRTMELGVALLWLGMYDVAYEHFENANRSRPKHISDFYAMAGVAKWCMDEVSQAVAQWQAGTEAAYADAAGGVTLPLLLFAASVLRAEVDAWSMAERLLAKRAAEPRAENWPGPLAKYVLHQIREEELRNQCPFPDREGVRSTGGYPASMSGLLKCIKDVPNGSRSHWNRRLRFRGRSMISVKSFSCSAFGRLSFLSPGGRQRGQCLKRGLTSGAIGCNGVVPPVPLEKSCAVESRGTSAGENPAR